MWKKNQVILAGLLLMATGFTACSWTQVHYPTDPMGHPIKLGQQHIATPTDNQSKSVYDWVVTTPVSFFKPRQPVILNFTIQNAVTGLPVSDFNELHTKLVHMIIVSKDLKTFSHIHPELLNQGNWKVEATFPRSGDYIAYIQFRPDQAPDQTLMKPIQVGAATLPTAHLIPDAQLPKVVDGYTFRLSGYPTQVNQPSMLTLAIEKAGKPVKTIEPYLGAGGHTVLLSQDAQSFLHVHPMTDIAGQYYQSPLQFHTEIAKPGFYKLWSQVQLQGKVETVDFTFQVR